MTDQPSNKGAEPGAVSHEDDGGSKGWLMVGGLVLLVGAGLFFGLIFFGDGEPQAEAQDTVPVVQVVEAAAEGRRYAITEEGFLRPKAEVIVTAEAAGRIAFVSHKLVPGGRFDKGEEMIRLDQREIAAQRQQARADLDAARADLEQARSDYSRQEELAKIGAAARATLERSTSTLAQAKARVAQAEAQVAIAEERFSDTVITAPFSATVARESAAIGAYVSPGQDLAQIFDNTAAEIPLGLSPADAAAIRRAQLASDGPLEVAIAPVANSASTRTLIGRVAEIASSLDPQARTVTVTIRVDDAFSKENVGFVYAQDFVEVTLPALAPADLYAAPSGVLRRDGYVWTVTDEETLQRIDVTPVKRDEDRVVFAAATELSSEPLLLTALTEEAEGMLVRIERPGSRLAQEKGLAAPPAADSGAGGAVR